MTALTHAVDIRRPVDEVFALAGDYRNDPQWRSGVVAMELAPPGPPTTKTITTERMRFFGREAVTVAEIVTFDAPHRTAFRSLTGPIPARGYRAFAPLPTGTRFTYSLTLKPSGIVGWLMRLYRPLLARQIRRDLTRLKAQLESQA